MYAQKSFRCVNNNHVDNMIVAVGYHYIVMFWLWDKNLKNYRSDYRVHEHIYTSLSVTWCETLHVLI